MDRTVDPEGTIDGHFNVVKELDYECELAVIIGKEAKDVEEKDAADYVFGYTIINDVTPGTCRWPTSSGTSERAWTPLPHGTLHRYGG